MVQETQVGAFYPSSETAAILCASSLCTYSIGDISSIAIASAHKMAAINIKDGYH